MELFSLSVYSPYRKILDEKVISLIAPTNDGLMGILAHHAPMATILKEGVLEVQKEDENRIFFAISNGVLEVNSDSEVLLLIDRVVKVESKQLDKNQIRELVQS